MERRSSLRFWQHLAAITALVVAGNTVLFNLEQLHHVNTTSILYIPYCGGGPADHLQKPKMGSSGGLRVLPFVKELTTERGRV